VPIYPQTRDGVPLLKEGEQVFEVRVYDKAIRKQVIRRVAGESAARAVEADLMAAVAVPLERRLPARLGPAARKPGRSLTNMTTRISVTQWAVQYLEYYLWRPDGTKRPMASYEHDRRCLSTYILPQIGDRTVASIQPAELDALVSKLTRKDGHTPLAGATKESVAGTLKRMFKMAERRGVLDWNPASGLPASWGAQARAAIVPSLEDVYRLAGCADERRQGYGDIIQLIAFTGMRWEELNAVRVDDVNWNDANIWIHWTATSSGGRRYLIELTQSDAGERRVPIPRQLEAPLARLIKVGDQRRVHNPGWSERLVVTNSVAAPLPYSSWRHVLNKAQKASGAGYTAHELRHVAAAMAIRSGITDTELAQMMGHANVLHTRQTYGHLLPTNRQTVAARMSAVIDQTKKQEQKLAQRHHEPRPHTTG
jgi:integrase